MERIYIKKLVWIIAPSFMLLLCCMYLALPIHVFAETTSVVSQVNIQSKNGETNGSIWTSVNGVVVEDIVINSSESPHGDFVHAAASSFHTPNLVQMSIDEVNQARLTSIIKTLTLIRNYYVALHEGQTK